MATWFWKVKGPEGLIHLAVYSSHSVVEECRLFCEDEYHSPTRYPEEQNDPPLTCLQCIAVND